jgi:metal-responsive CopG/Arc/MetJ family transcriptional regulator
MNSVGVRLPADLEDRVDDLANRLGICRSEAMRCLLRAGLGSARGIRKAKPRLRSSHYRSVGCFKDDAGEWHCTPS